MNTSSGIGVFTKFDDTINEDTSVGVASVVKEDVTPSVVDMMVEKENLEDTTVLKSFPPLTTPVTTTAGNAPGKSSYANIIGKPSGKKVNVRTLFTPGGNGIDVVVSVDSIRAISERFANTAYGFFWGRRWHTMFFMDGLDAMLENGPWFIWNNPLILKKWHPDENLLKEDVSTVLVWVKLHGVPVTAFNEDGLSAIATKLVMIELRVDVELKDNIVVAMPKITREGHYTCNVRVEYEWKPPWCSSCKIFGHIHEACPKNAGAGEKKTVKKPSVEPTIEVSNSNTFYVLNSVDNDVEFGTNGETTNLVNNGATSSGSSFMNVDNSSAGTTLIIDKIRKFEDLLTSGQDILVDKAGNPLKKVEFPGEYDSEAEVASVDNDMTRFMASERVGFGTQSLLEQWRDSYGNGDYDDDPYNDDCTKVPKSCIYNFVLEGS
ncbi:zinc finger, CCHC-type containing protein, partial [Tanacetum coccineum]